MVQLLVKTKLLHSDAKNIEEKSALDITTNEESISILVRTKAEVINPWPVSDLRTFMSHIKGDITENQRNAYLVIAALDITATYHSALSPPGGLYQANTVNNNANATSINS